ncbi:MAG: flavin reductase family protein [Sphingobacteriia bacterium]|nr:flavin reductase family protein [Sphingobacteriia bacterium]
MFYELKENNHNLKYNPFKSCIIPRPIGWVSTLSPNKIVNIAPFSYFNAISDHPAMVMLSITSHPNNGGYKDTFRNIKALKEFVINVATYELKDYMNLTSLTLPYEQSEAEFANIELEPSNLIKPLRIKNSPIALECKLHEIINLPAENPVKSNSLILGQVIGIYIKDEFIKDDKVDVEKIKPLARLGYHDYAVIDKIFEMKRPNSTLTLKKL